MSPGFSIISLRKSSRTVLAQKDLEFPPRNTIAGFICSIDPQSCDFTQAGLNCSLSCPPAMRVRATRDVPSQLLVEIPSMTAPQRHVLSALVMNQPGVLAHISGMLASRAF